MKIFLLLLYYHKTLPYCVLGSLGECWEDSYRSNKGCAEMYWYHVACIFFISPPLFQNSHLTRSASTYYYPGSHHFLYNNFVEWYFIIISHTRSFLTNHVKSVKIVNILGQIFNCGQYGADIKAEQTHVCRGGLHFYIGMLQRKLLGTKWNVWKAPHSNVKFSSLRHRHVSM